MIPIGSRRRWATAAEWNVYRDVISRLYRDMELDELMAIMERDHGFHSTYCIAGAQIQRETG